MHASYDGGFDVHTHLDSPAFDRDRALVVSRAVGAGVLGVAVAAAARARWAEVRGAGQVAFDGGMTHVSVGLGVHPWCLRGDPTDACAALLAAAPQTIGEVGLDAVRAGIGDAATQRVWLRAQLAVARSLNVPVVLHCVRAEDALLAVLRADGLPVAGGLIHGFDGTSHQVTQAVALGLHLSLGPGALRPGRRRAAMVRAIPADRLLLETDCPDHPVAGAVRGEPAHLVAVAQGVAALRAEAPEGLFRRAGALARALFG